MTRGEIRLKNETLAVLDNYLLTRGIPLPPGQVRSPAGVSITDDQGRVLASEGRVLQRRPDGSIEWLQLDILVPLGGQEAKSIYIEPRAARAPHVANPVTVTERRGSVTLSNGVTTVELSRQGGSLIRRLVVNCREIVIPGMLVDLQVADSGGKIYRASLSGPYQIRVTHRNRLRTEVTLAGKHTARDGAAFIDFALRFTLTAGSPDLKLEHTFYCREPQEGKIAIRFMRLVMPTTMDPAAAKLLRQSIHGYDNAVRDVEVPENVEVVAAGTGDLDQYRDPGAGVVHPTAGGAVFLRNLDSFHEDWSEYPFTMRPGQGTGFRSWHASVGMRHVSPVVGWKQKDFTLVTAFEHFRQLHPKSIEIDESLLTWSIWPSWSTPMEVVQGVSKSHVCWITGARRARAMDEVLDILYRWEYGYVEPVDASFDPAWPAACAVLDCQHLLKYQPEKYPLLENLIEVAPAAGNPARHTYDRLPATGMFHFGDIVTADQTIPCANNEDDVNVFFPLQQFLRTGHTYAWDHGKEMARHYMEVDWREFSTVDRERGGLIPHAANHFLGCVYPSHQWAEGILAYYYLSGDERARTVVIACADNHVWWAFHKTAEVCSDGREAGMPLVNLAAAYRLTRDDKYIKAARHIIKNFFLKWEKKYGVFKYPYPQNARNYRPHKLITGYGDWSSFAGLYRLWEVTGNEEFRTLGVRLLQAAIKPGSFSLNDARGMDFFAAWALGRMTGNMDEAIDRVRSAIPTLLRRGGHPLRRLHFLKELDDRGLIDDQDVGSRAG